MRQKIINLVKRHLYLKTGEYVRTQAGNCVACLRRYGPTAVLLKRGIRIETNTIRRFLVITQGHGSWVVEYIKRIHEKHGHWAVLPYKTSVGQTMFEFEVMGMLAKKKYTVFASSTIEAIEKLQDEGRGDWEPILSMKTTLDIMNE